MSIVSNSKLQPVLLDINEENWLDLLGKPLYSRENYKIENGTYIFGQLVGQFLGVPEKVDDYFNHLYDIVHDPKLKIHLLTRDNMEKYISQENFHELQKIYLANKKYHFSIDKILALLAGKQLLPMTSNEKLNNHIRNAIARVLNKFILEHKEGLLDTSFRRVFIDMIKWSHHYLDKWFNNTIIEKEMPKVLWYSDGTESNIYFLYCLKYLGCDLFIFNTSGKSLLMESDGEESIYVHSYTNKVDSIPFPKLKNRKETIAFKASKEIEKVIYDDETIFYKPWQFHSYIPKALTLKTTYDEIFLLLKEKAFIRPYFSIENNEIRIPNIFAKVSGISEDKNDYWQKIENITSYELILLEKKFPFTSTISIKHEYFDESMSNNGMLNPKKVMMSKWWKYSHLPEGLQFGMATAISRLCADPKLKLAPNETKRDIQLFLFSQATSLPVKFIELLQKYDYAQEVPRVILYHNEKNGKLSRADASILLLLNELGIDILLYNPTRTKDLENYIEDSYFDIHWLEEIALDQEFKDITVFQRFFSNVLKSIKEE